jgi:hypothetical protein
MTGPANGGRADTPEATAAVAQSRTGADVPQRQAKAKRIGRGTEGRDYEIGPGVTRALHARTYEAKPGDPIYRQLKIYALDPGASRRDGAIAVVNVPYEKLMPGPRGRLLRVEDSVTKGVLDLDEHRNLLSQGLTPSPSNPLFRNQMVYAVCSTTYAAFRHALGRDIAWGFTPRSPDGSDDQLILRPTVERQRNAYYNHSTGEIFFGIFTADRKVYGPGNLPHGEVSSCLSHDVVVHEMTHAILDGLRSEFMRPSNPDVPAFHEAFADLVAIFQRFTYKDVVRQAIRNSRGNVRSAKLLTDIALQFGQTTGLTGALRSAVAGTERRYGDSNEAHERAEVLVAAVFEAFATVYGQKTRWIVKLATGGSGELPPGDINDALVEALTDRACKLASQFLSVCIRAIDYCPPVDITFGEYLRAVITADIDLVPDDDWQYREAWIEAFNKYEIYPADVANLSEDALRWNASGVELPIEPELRFDRIQYSRDPSHVPETAEGERTLIEEVRRQITDQARAVGALVGDPEYAAAFGLCTEREMEGDAIDLPVIHSVRSARRAGPDGQLVFDLVAEVTQRRGVRTHAGIPGFDFYGGATVILDPWGKVRYVIRKSLSSADRLDRQRKVIGEDSPFWGIGPGGRMYPQDGFFRLLHDAAGRGDR